MLSKGLEECVCAYPMAAWTKLEDKMNDLSVFDSKSRNFMRRFFSGSGECEIDRQGRTLINQAFRSFGKLEKEVYIIGAGDHLEIWDKGKWEQYRGGLDDDFPAIAEEILK